MTGKLSLDQRMQKQSAAYTANASMTAEQKRRYGAKGIGVYIRKQIDPDGVLERTNSAEFARKYDMALKARMIDLRARSVKTLSEKTLKKTLHLLPLTVKICPQCNAEDGHPVPSGVEQELCVKHFFAAQALHFNAVLDQVAV